MDRVKFRRFIPPDTPVTLEVALTAARAVRVKVRALVDGKWRARAGKCSCSTLRLMALRRRHASRPSRSVSPACGPIIWRLLNVPRPGLERTA